LEDPGFSVGAFWLGKNLPAFHWRTVAFQSLIGFFPFTQPLPCHLWKAYSASESGRLMDEKKARNSSIVPRAFGFGSGGSRGDGLGHYGSC
jgi:hypothetical protein